MALVRCVDGTVLAVRPMPVLDRDGVPYEVTLRLEREGALFGEVGERCGYFLASAAARLRKARAAGQAFPVSSLEGGLRAWAVDRGRQGDPTWEELQRYVPRDRELFCFRSRDPDDLATVGELRVTLQVERDWTDQGWVTCDVAWLEAWGESGQGVRARLDSEQLLDFLAGLVQEFADAYEDREATSGLRRPVG